MQVAGNFRRAAAVRQWERVNARFPALLAGHEPVVSRVRTAVGRRGIYAVRIGVDTRKTPTSSAATARRRRRMCRGAEPVKPRPQR